MSAFRERFTYGMLTLGIIGIPALMWYFSWTRERALTAPAVEAPLFNVDKQNVKPAPDEKKNDAPSQAEHALWMRYLDLAKTSKSRRDVLTNMQNLRWHKETDEAVTILERMVREDANHAGKPFRIWWLRSTDEKITELIFGLRDQTCTQDKYWEPCDLFADTKSPAEQLVSYGYEAAPQLIAHLDDARFTRAVFFPHQGRFQPVVLRFGDCALAVLDRIAARNFTEAHYSQFHHKGNPAEVKKAAELWWQDFQQKGERQMLIDGTKAADRNTAAQADALYAKFPADAQAAIGHAVRVSTDKDLGSQLLWKVRAKNDPDEKEIQPEVLEFFREFLDHKQVNVRVAAADILCAYGDKGAVKKLLAEWNEHRNDNNYEGPRSKVAAAMLRCKDPAAVDLICTQWRDLPPRLRYELIDHFHFNGASVLARPQNRKLFLQALGDKSRMEGYSSSQGDKVLYRDPRICDRAADLLAQGLQEPAFPHMGPEADRDREVDRLRAILLAKE